MNFAQGEGDLRSRYRRQSSRSVTHAPTRSRSSVHLRPHAQKQSSPQASKPLQEAAVVHKHKEVAATPSAMFSLAARGYKTNSHSMGSRMLARGPVSADHILGQEVRKRPKTTTQSTVDNKASRHERSTFKVEFNIPTRSDIKNLFTVMVSKIFGGQKIKQPQAILLGAAGFVFIFGLTISIMGWKANTHVEAQAAQIQRQSASTAADTETDETEISQAAIGSYTVPADHPKRITISKTKTYARVLNMGLKNGNQLDAPKNIFDTGWYNKSAKPGSGGGAVLIDGHVHGKRKKGVFYNLKTLVAGDQIKVERGDGQIVTYEVVKTQSYPQDNVDMTAAMLPIENGKEGLNLITCHGDLDGTAYQERLIVFAVRVS